FFREQAGALEGTDPDYSQRDLFHAIKTGNFPKWRVCVQIMPEKDAETYHINPFDLTKVWPHKDYPLVEVGELELNRNPENYFTEVGQAPFEPRNIVPGMGFSPDKMLQARLISYPDAHRYRLGVNYDSLPVNKPQCPYHTYNKDGAMRFDGNGGAAVNYEPNSFGGPTQDRSYVERPRAVSGTVARHDHRTESDYYTQPGNLFRLMPADARQRLITTSSPAWAMACHSAFKSCKSSTFTRPIRHMEPAWQRGWGGISHESRRSRNSPAGPSESGAVVQVETQSQVSA